MYIYDTLMWQGALPSVWFILCTCVTCDNFWVYRVYKFTSVLLLVCMLLFAYVLVVAVVVYTCLFVFACLFAAVCICNAICSL